MIEALKNLLIGHNEFASGGLVLMIVGGLGVYLRSIPLRLWHWCVCQITMMITIQDDDAAFVWVKEWFLEQGFLKRIRRVDVDTTLRGQNLSLVPAPGRHWFWHAGRPFVVDFYRAEEPKSWSRKRSESLTFRTLGRNQKFLKRLVNEIVEAHQKRAGAKSSLFLHDDGWIRVLGYAPRSLASVVLHPGEKEHLVQDIETFKASRKRYTDLGVPYHRGYLLHGPPGTGKTSLASGIAEHFEMPIYAINLNQFNDRTLITAICDVPPNSIILFEDIDCMESGRARIEDRYLSENCNRPVETKDKDLSDKLGVSLSGLLNILDGLCAPDSLLFIMTSNQIESLDPALLRPGRIDYRLYMGEASDRQKMELYSRFFPSASELEARAFLEVHSSAKTMAEFQGLLLGSLEKSTSDDTVLNALVE